MKVKYSVFMVAILAVIACSKNNTPPVATGACAASKILGTYVGNSNGQADTIKFNADCSGTDSYAKATFSYTSISNTSGTTNISVSAETNNDAAALFNGVGTSSCDYTVSGTSLTLFCNGDSQGSYTKQ